MVFGSFEANCAKKWVRFSAKTGPIALIAIATSAAFGQIKPLNDTGINFCGGASSGNNSPCLSADPAGQDRHYGRDGAARTGALPAKTGGSAGAADGSPNGFDFTKIANDGSTLGPNAALGTGPTEWACTKDNVTGLVWEVKTTSGLRSQAHTYTWFKTGSPDGDGIVSGGTCAMTGRCDIEKFVADVSATTLCGYGDWRMPSVKELEGIVDYGRTTVPVDSVFFPNTPSVFMWSGTPSPYASSHAWYVNFGRGDAYFTGRSGAYPVRLVRGG